jgi:hypothetical protein
MKRWLASLLTLALIFGITQSCAKMYAPTESHAHHHNHASQSTDSSSAPSPQLVCVNMLSTCHVAIINAMYVPQPPAATRQSANQLGVYFKVSLPPLTPPPKVSFYKPHIGNLFF